MKKLIFVLICVISFSLCGCSASESKTQGSSAEEAISFGVFSSADIYGNEATESIFEDADITMVNIWATFCAPCKKEMPELAELRDENSERSFQIVGIITDAYSEDDSEKAKEQVNKNIESAKEIVLSSGADYTHILLNKELSDGPLKNLIYVPTTIFVDKEGKQIGEIYVGAKTKEEWQKIVDEVFEVSQNNG